MALLVGLIEIVLGVARLGFVADLLSKEVQVGYMNGLAITIVVAQLPKLCGFSTDADGFVDELRAFVHDFGERDHDDPARPDDARRAPRAPPDQPAGPGGPGRRRRLHRRHRPVRARQ